jgi:endonuclease-3
VPASASSTAPAPRPDTALVRRARKIDRVLAQTYPDARCELDFETPFELLVVTVLSAQTTDRRVNAVRPTLFAAYPDATAMAAAPREHLEQIVGPLGFFRAKTDALLKLSQALVERYDGEVPGRLEDLVTLPGVGRKTANVVLNMAFGQPTMAVDTHIFRIGNRIGLAPGKTPEEVEAGLIRVIPPEYMRHAHHWLILHGRYVCKARRPECERCVIADICKAAVKTNSVPAPLVELKADALPEPA